MLKSLVPIVIVLLVFVALPAWLIHKVHHSRFGPNVAVAPKTVAPPFVPPTAPIEFQQRWWIDEGQMGMGIGGLLFAVFLFTRDTGWLSLLAWPVGALALLFSGLSFHAAWSEWGTRYAADATGLQIRDRSTTRSIPWSRAARVQLREVYGAMGSSTHHQTTTVRSRSIDFLDATGASLLRLDLPLKPTPAGVALEASLPVWLGRPLEVVPINR